MLLEFLRQWSNVFLFLMNAGVTVLLWSLRQTFATKEDAAEIAERVAALEQARKNSPTRRDIHSLRMEMERMRGDMKTFATGMNGQRDLFAAEIRGARDLIVRTERMVGLLAEHHMEEKG